MDEYPLVPVADGLYVVRPEGTQTWFPVTFYTLDSGEEYLHFGVRATPKVPHAEPLPGTAAREAAPQSVPGTAR
nr:hypothetical protein GCM10025730_14980 [Promicromonospora thailandica]